MMLVYFLRRHSGAQRTLRTKMCNCTSENLEIPGLVLAHHPGMTAAISRNIHRTSGPTRVPRNPEQQVEF
jgi:hypothetical protein